MKILLLDVNCKFSSTGQIVYNLYTFLNQYGETAAICYGRGKEIHEKNIFKFGLDLETKLHALLTRLTGYTGCFSYFSTWRLIQFIEKFQPDVVHIHELHAYFVNDTQLLSYLSKKGIKVVHTLHCEFSYTGKCGHSLMCDKWKTVCKDCPLRRHYPASLFFDRTQEMFKAKKKAFGAIRELVITTPSLWLTERAKQSFFKERRIITIHNGIDTDIFRPVNTDNIRKKYSIDEKEKVVLALAPHLLSESKGGLFVLRMAKDLRDKVRFILIGVDGEKERVEGNTIILGPIYDKVLLAQFYSLADLFVICSNRENYPTTCLEAQACGTPICGFDTGGIRETCITEKEGRFVEFGDLISLQKIICETPKKPNSTSEWLAKNAHIILSKNSMANKFLEIYRSLL